MTIYLFRERVTDVAPPVGYLVVVEQEDTADPPVLVEVPDEPHVQPLTPREMEVLRPMALESWPETDRIMARGYTPGNQG